MKHMKYLLIWILGVSLTANGQSVDLSVRLADAQMQRENPMTQWKYYYGFYMYSLFRVYERTKDPEQLAFIETWAAANVAAQLSPKKQFRSLDDIYPGLVMLCLYEQTGRQQYKDVADKIKTALNTYSRTKTGGFYHDLNSERQGQLWLDGLYMVNVFLAKYGQVTGDHACFQEAVRQIMIYTDALKDPKTGLYYHAYDESAELDIFDKEKKHSREFWGRSIGWTMMAMVEVLDIIPDNHPERGKLLERLRELATALVPFQDAKTGLWYQVLDKGQNPKNWLETSCSAMFSYAIAKAVHRGFLDESFLPTALRGYQGVIKEKIIIEDDGRYGVKDVSDGTVVGDLDYYLNRPAMTNNLRGLPAVILLCEEMRNQPAQEAEQKKTAGKTKQ